MYGGSVFSLVVVEHVHIGMSSPFIAHQLGLEFELLKSILVSIPDVSLGVKMD